MNAKVKINPTPSEQLIAQAVQENVITDSTGRKITIRRPAPLAQFRFLDATGNFSQRRLNASMPLIFVTDIDGALVPPLEKESQVEALIVRLGNEGLVAVAEGVELHFGEITPESDKAALKK